MAPPRMTIRYFRTPAEFRRWLQQYHETTDMLWVGFHKRDSGQASITWPESVDQALCFGWIDGLRKSVSETSYVIRFTPRREGSIWSAINIKRAEALRKEGLMRPAGLRAFDRRKENKSGVYSYERRSERLPSPYERTLRENPAAWAFWQAQPPWYRKTAGWWVVSAKKEETRQKRLHLLLKDSAEGRRLDSVARYKPAGKPKP